MSLMPFGGRHALHPALHRHTYDPYGMGLDPYYGLSTALDHFFDDSSQLLRLRDHAAKLEFTDDGGFNYKVDASGFRPQELKVDVEGDDLVVRGEHREENHGEQVERTFFRRVRLPEGIHRDSVKCEMDERGRLTVCGARTAIEQAQRRSVPIDFKQGSHHKQAIGNGIASKQGK